MDRPHVDAIDIASAIVRLELSSPAQFHPQFTAIPRLWNWQPDGRTTLTGGRQFHHYNAEGAAYFAFKVPAKERL